YSELSWEARVKYLFGDPRLPATLSGALGGSLRDYPYRPPQNGDGLYQDGHQRAQTWSLSGAAAYPVGGGFSLAAEWRWVRGLSNQNYERTYAYNYAVTSYLLGVTYEY